jgi:hypothetical protein
VVECTGLENRRRGNSSAGSNPAPSANTRAEVAGSRVVFAVARASPSCRRRPPETALRGQLRSHIGPMGRSYRPPPRYPISESVARDVVRAGAPRGRQVDGMIRRPACAPRRLSCLSGPSIVLSPIYARAKGPYSRARRVLYRTRAGREACPVDAPRSPTTLKAHP